MRLLVYLLALLSMGFAACSGTIYKYVPAVVGSDGELVNVSMSLVPGTGTTFVSVYPRTGLMTQDSVDGAITYARGLSGSGDGCDVLVDFGSNPSTNLIDGPSAGTALTTMAYSLLTGKPERDDAIITGTIDPAGDVGPVGGLYEKATGAARMGAKYFITPPESFYEILLLRNVELKYGIQVLQAQKVEDVIGFMTQNLSIPQQPLSARMRSIPQLPQYDDTRIAGLAPVAQSMIDLEDGLASSFPVQDNDTQVMKAFFQNEVQRQQKIDSSGYLFSAANEAFLNYIDLSTIRIILDGNVDLPRARGDVGICLTNITRPNLTDANFEWVVGADLRQQWAYDKLNNITTDSNMIEDEKVVEYNDLMYAQGWCDVAKGLLAAAPAGGKPIDESAWKGLAQSQISQAKAIGPSSEDTTAKLQSAEESYDAGHYGAAIYDAVYVISTEESARSNETGAYKGLTMGSLWGNIYESHAAYLSALNQSDAAASTEAFALAIDNATAQMRQEMEPASQAPPQTQQPGGDATLLYAAAGISILLLIVVVILLLSGKDGDNGKGSLKAPRAKQKKG